MPGVPVTCGDYRVLTTIAHGLRVHRAPGIPHALIFLGEKFQHASGASRREIAKPCRDPSHPSSSAKADDPVFRGACDRTEEPQRTGYPACAGYDDSCVITLDVIARSEATKQSILSFQRNGLLRGACHRARISRDPLARNDGLTRHAAQPSSSAKERVKDADLILMSLPPGPREARPDDKLRKRLEGWAQRRDSRPSFETRAGRAPPAITAKPLRRDEVGNMITTSKAATPRSLSKIHFNGAGGLANLHRLHASDVLANQSGASPCRTPRQKSLSHSSWSWPPLPLHWRDPRVERAWEMCPSAALRRARQTPVG
jgi:hypothetical protein